MTRLGYTIFYVDSVPNTLAFWEQAFGLKTRFLHEGKDYGELATGETALAFTSHELASQAVPTPYRRSDEGVPLGTELTLTNPEVDGLYAQAVNAGAKSVASPHDTPWGQRVAYVLDPNNILVGLATPMGD